MSVQPIDLQVLISHMPDVGKDQAIQKDAIQLAQIAQGNQLVQKTEQQSHSVNESKETDEVQQVKDRTGGGKKSRSGQGRKGKSRKGEPKEVFSDPQIGKNVDISG